MQVREERKRYLISMHSKDKRKRRRDLTSQFHRRIHTQSNCAICQAISLRKTSRELWASLVM